MQPGLCKLHFRQVANYFDREVALAYAPDEKGCVLCNKIIFIEAARRFIEKHNERSVEQAPHRSKVYA